MKRRVVVEILSDESVVCQPGPRLNNALVQDGENLLVVGETQVVLWRTGQGCICRFSGLVNVKGAALSGAHLLLFEDTRFSLFVQAEEHEWKRWKVLFRSTVPFFAYDCALAVSGDVITVLAATVLGLQVWRIDKSSKHVDLPRTIFPGHSISSVTVAKHSHSVALATLDGHFGLWSLKDLLSNRNPTAGSSFLWFAESGARITSLVFSHAEDKCALVCWDGRGAIFAHFNGGAWRQVRQFEPSMLFQTQDASSSLGPPSLCRWSHDDVLLHVLMNGGLKSFGDESVGFNVNLIGKEASLLGFCNVSSDNQYATIDETGTLALLEVRLS